MIRVTVELVSAKTGSAMVLGIAEIANDGNTSYGTGGLLGSYNAKFSKWAPKQHETWKRARIVNFDRKGRGAWDLLYLLLREAVGKRNL